MVDKLPITDKNKKIHKKFIKIKYAILLTNQHQLLVKHRLLTGYQNKLLKQSILNFWKQYV